VVDTLEKLDLKYPDLETEMDV